MDAHELKTIDTSHYTDEMWAREIYGYLRKTGANRKRVFAELNRLNLSGFIADKTIKNNPKKQ